MENYTGMSDREILVVLAERSEKTDKALFGNGQPGLVQVVSKHTEQLDELGRDADFDRRSHLSWRTVIFSALVSTLLAAASTAALLVH